MMKLTVFLVCAVAHLSSAVPFSGKIIGGQLAKQGQFPFIVSLQDSSFKSHFCGGGLISDRLIVSAAHCFADNRDPADTVVFVGSSDLASGGTYYKLSRVVVNEKFNSFQLTNDISLLQTATPVALGPDVAVLKLPTAGLAIPGGSKVIALGWGSTRFPNPIYPTKLNYVEIGVVDNKACSNALDDTIADSQICVGGEDGHGLCYGDSGSPLVLNGDTTVGIVSWGEPCGIGYPDVFTRVSSFVDWIETNSKALEAME